MYWSGRAVAVLPVMNLSIYVLPCHLSESGCFSPPVPIRAVNAASFFHVLVGVESLGQKLQCTKLFTQC